MISEQQLNLNSGQVHKSHSMASDHELPELEVSILDSSSSSEEDEENDNDNTTTIQKTDYEDEYNINNDEDNTDEEENSGYNQAIRCMEEAVQVQELKLGKHHAAVSRTLHGLALEHRNRGQYDRALSCLQKALALIDERIEIANNAGEHNGDESPTLRLLEEKSVIFACQASVYRMRNMFTESMDSYVSSVDTLVEAGYDGTSRRICMLMRIMKRAAFQQRGNDCQ